jgi:hypothetical protein
LYAVSPGNRTTWATVPITTAAPAMSVLRPRKGAAGDIGNNPSSGRTRGSPMAVLTVNVAP